MASFFELCQARTWALYTLKGHDVRIYLDISHVTDPAWEWFLTEIPQQSGCTRIEEWNTKKEGKYLTYSKDLSTDNAEVYIHIFECPTSKKTKYVGLYNKDGKRHCDICLVIWNTDHPHVTNPGFAPGRCPDLAHGDHTMEGSV